MAHIVGTSGNDNLNGAGEDDLIEGFGGNDFLGGADGDDTLLGGDGDDILSGGVGSDLSSAGAGNDVIVIDADGSDTALGGAGDDFIIATQSPGAGGTCRIDGGKGADEIVVSEQALVTDFIIAGGDDNDYVQIQQARAARIDLGTGNDWLYIQGGQNGVTLGGGHDLLQFSSALGGIRVKDFAATGASSDSLSLGNILAHATDWDQVSNPFSSGFVRVRQKGADTNVQVDFDGPSGPVGWFTIAKLESVTASQLTAANLAGYAPTGGAIVSSSFVGTNKADYLLGGGGNDTMSGGAGDDLLDGQLGNDVLNGGIGNDQLVDGLGGDDRLVGGDGNDQLNAQRNTTASSVNDDHITLDGGAGNDQLFHSSLGSQDAMITVLGGSGDDQVVMGQAAGVTVTGGAGADTIDSTAADTLLIYAAVAESNTVIADRLVNFGNDWTIDLSAIDANTSVAGDQAFVLVGVLSGAAGELAPRYDLGTDTTWFEGDVDGDGLVDLAIVAEHDHTSFDSFVL